MIIFKRLKDKYSKIVYLNIGLSNKDGSRFIHMRMMLIINSLIKIFYKSRKIARNNIEKFEEEKIVKLKLDSSQMKKIIKN